MFFFNELTCSHFPSIIDGIFLRLIVHKSEEENNHLKIYFNKCMFKGLIYEQQLTFRNRSVAENKYSRLPIDQAYGTNQKKLAQSEAEFKEFVLNFSKFKLALN